MRLPRLRWLINSLAIVVLLCVTNVVLAQDAPGTHTVQQGENLFRIALRYNTTVEALAAANNITDPTHVYVGQVLIIPGGATPPQQPQQPTPMPGIAITGTPPPPLPAPVNPQAGNAGPVLYTVQQGDTLSIISRKFGVSLGALLAANQLLDPNHIVPGQQITVPGTSSPSGNATIPNLPNVVSVQPAPATPIPPQPQPASGPQTHIVQPGEGLAAIGRLYNIPWTDIATANNITDPNTIYAGMTLVIPGSQPPSTTMETSVGGPPGPPAAAAGGKSIVVVLHEQRVYAYENGTLVHTTLASTGLPGSPTVQGDFAIYVKYTATLMVGPGYYLPGVPWTMYFYQGYGLHGTYWHHNFGHPMSHGCVNLPTDEAEWYFNWADIGTPVHVQA